MPTKTQCFGDSENLLNRKQLKFAALNPQRGL